MFSRKEMWRLLRFTADCAFSAFPRGLARSQPAACSCPPSLQTRQEFAVLADWKQSSGRLSCSVRSYATKTPGASAEASEEPEEIDTGAAATGEGSAPKSSAVDLSEGNRDPKDRTRIIPWQVSAEYIKSRAYFNTYGSVPVWKPYRRAHKGVFPKRKTRPTCIENGKIIRASACPICRDEYLVLDYRNPELLQQFISPYTAEILPWSVTNLCQMKHWRMVVEMEKAKYFGTMQFKVPFRRYDYADYYGPDWRRQNTRESSVASDSSTVSEEAESKERSRQS